jgi:magnesium-transporting ATPase (P-type)
MRYAPIVSHRTNQFPSDMFVIITLLIPILRYYNLGNTSIGMEMFLTLLAFSLGFVLLISFGKRNIRELKNPQRWFVIFCFLVTLFYELFTNINISNAAATYTGNIFMFMILNILLICIILSGCFNASRGIKIYSVIVHILISVYVYNGCFMLSE